MKPVTDALLPSSSSSFCSAAAVANNPLRHRQSTPPPPFAIAAVRRPTTPCSSSHCRLSGPLLLIAGLLLLAQSLKATDPFQTQNEWEEHRICGRLLINALKTVCNHQYAQPTREQLYDNYYKNPGMVFRARRGSASIAPLLGGGSARRRRGIIWECCTNKCSLNYIRNNYCAQGPTGEGGLGAAAWQLVDERR